MIMCCALFLYLWYGTDCTAGRDDLNLTFPQFVPPTMAGVSRVYVLGTGYRQEPGNGRKIESVVPRDEVLEILFRVLPRLVRAFLHFVR